MEAQFFRAINGVVEPAVRAGWASPGCTPNTMIVLETIGRKSGKTYCTPLAATRLGDRVYISTLRSGRSHWLKNLAATPSAGYWLAGRRHDAEAIVFTAGAAKLDRATLPSFLGPMAPLLELLVDGFGFGVAVLTPRPP